MKKILLLIPIFIILLGFIIIPNILAQENDLQDKQLDDKSQSDLTQEPIQAMTIDSKGNVGIGTSTPQANLDVHGNVFLSSYGYDGPRYLQLRSFAGTYDKAINLEAYNGPNIEGYQIGNGGGYGVDSNFFLNSYTAPRSENPGITVNNVTSNRIITVTPDGNVGIGTTIPKGKMSINNVGHNDDTKLLIFSEDESPEFYFESGFSPRGGDNYLKLKSWLGNNPMTWKADGNVGIGTTIPKGKMSINNVGHNDDTKLLIFSEDESPGFYFESGFSPRGGDNYLKLKSWLGNNPMTWKADGNVGIGTSSPSQILDVNGNAIANQWLTHSSQKWTKDIAPLDDVLYKVIQINGVMYNLKTNEFPDKKFNNGLQIGIIAEELEQIYPELVHTSPNGDKSIQYGKLTPILIEAIKEQQNEINKQQELFDEQQSTLEQLKSVICPDHPELDACQNGNYEYLS